MVLLQEDDKSPFLENIIYQQSLCELILDGNEAAQKGLIRLIKLRKHLYTVRGCCQVDPAKLLLTPYKQLGVVYEEQG